MHVLQYDIQLSHAQRQRLAAIAIAAAALAATAVSHAIRIPPAEGGEIRRQGDSLNMAIVKVHDMVMCTWHEGDYGCRVPVAAKVRTSDKRQRSI